MTEHKYCGFVCDDVKEQQQAIAKELHELWKVNPEFAKEFRQQMVEILVKSAP